jgi:protein-disulfide isomerase
MMSTVSRRAVMTGMGMTLAAFAMPALAQDAPKVPEIKDFSLGAADAKIKIVEYASFTCPHCAAFHAGSFAKLKTEYIDTGKVNFTLREVYFDRYGLWAAMVARCGGDMKYFFIHDQLFDKQKEWAASDDPNVVIANLKGIARAAGMEDAAVDVCLKDSATAEAMVARYQANMEADKVEGTPTIFVNGTKYSNMSYPDLKAILDAELAKAG